MRIVGTSSDVRVAMAYGVAPRAVAPVKECAAAEGLVARRVGVGVEFSGPAGGEARGLPAGDTFRMYTRSADINEVATGVAIGRAIDLNG